VAADDYLEGKEVLGEIQECLETTPERQRLAFTLREIEELETTEICKIMDITATNLGVMLFRARNRLRECLESKGVQR
jgi:RNA polymerase sigma-70 factor (ECF subfamily)